MPQSTAFFTSTLVAEEKEVAEVTAFLLFEGVMLLSSSCYCTKTAVNVLKGPEL